MAQQKDTSPAAVWARQNRLALLEKAIAELIEKRDRIIYAEKNNVSE